MPLTSSLCSGERQGALSQLHLLCQRGPLRGRWNPQGKMGAAINQLVVLSVMKLKNTKI